jgi:indolepyruvate ferredoxin oxidoreductase alpha subunit
MKKVLLGNEAIARGAWEAGVVFASAYPGTPSTEILESLIEYPEVQAEWAPNEKDAVLAAAGASLTGARALAAMKHVGLNVASDPLMTLSYTGIEGGLVIVTADDPSLYSSQNEQDNRHYARFAKVPMLEPSDAQEAKDFTKLAFEISEQFDTPVLLRTVTRVSHTRGVVELGERQEPNRTYDLKPNEKKYTMIPAFAGPRHIFVEERMKKLKEFAEGFEHNRIEWGDKKVGIITSGIAYQYAKEVFPQYSFLKLGMVWPLPEKKIKEFASQVEEVWVIEELDPFLEENLKAMGIKVSLGKDRIPICGELSPTIIKEAIEGKPYEPSIKYHSPIPQRPPNLCPGCPHRGVFYVLKKLKVFTFGDIGCYTLATLPPLSSLHTCVCMGSSIGMLEGAVQVLKEKALNKTVAVLGDSTFLHAGITPLLGITYNKANGTVIVLDNWTTAMTGSQEHPGSGYTAKGEGTFAVNYVELAKALGVKEENIREINPYDLEETERVIKEEIGKNEPSFIVTKNSPCALLRRAIERYNPPLFVDENLCTGCRQCLELGCPAIYWDSSKAGEYTTKDGKTKKRKGISRINDLLCNGCGLCYQVCKFGAIKAHTEVPPKGFKVKREEK